MSDAGIPVGGREGSGPEAVARARLSEKHIADLRASGLSWETIVQGEFRTLHDPKALNALLKRRDASRLGPCLLLPYFDLDGRQVVGYVRAKPDNAPPGKKEDGKPAKYLSPARVAIRAYFPAGAGTAILDPGRAIAVTEGEKKAAAVWQVGTAVVGLAGVECWSKRRPKGADGRAQGRRHLLDELLRLPWQGRTVYLVFDSDVTQKREVLQAEVSLARALAELGAIVKLVRIPHPTDGSKLGIDDYLSRQAEPRAALDGLLDQAIDYGESIRRVEAGQYRVQDGRIVRLLLTKDGPVESALCNFDARIVDELIRDDGSGETTLVFGIEGALAIGRPLRRVDVTGDRFGTMNWPSESWGSRAIVNAGQGCRDHLRAAIQSLSDATTRTVYTHLGWRMIDGVWHFLHAGGAISPSGSAAGVCCGPPQPLRQFLLPDPPTGDRLRTAIRTSLRLLDGRTRPRVMFPIFAAIFRAPLGSGDFSVFLAGPTGVFKSELAAIAQQHFGRGMDARHLPANWASTGNALEGIAFSAKDCLLTVDDFAPSGTSADVHRVHREAERLFRAQGNNQGRHRMSSDISLRAERPPRGLILSTGEDIPRGHSIRARLAVVEVSNGDIPGDALTEYQRAAGAGEYAAAMAGYVQHLAADYSSIQGRLAGERTALRDDFAAAGAHARTPGAFADLALGMRHFLEFAVSVGAIAPADRDELWSRARLAFVEVMGEQAEHLSTADPVDFYLRLLRAALASGRAHVSDRAGARPGECPESWGWRSREVGMARDQSDWQPQGHRIGWLDAGSVYLEPDGAFAEVQRLAGEQGQTIPLAPRTLHRRLYERGLLERVEKAGDKTRYCVRVTLEGQRREVLCLSAGTLFPTGSAPSAPNGEQSATGTDESERTPLPECADSSVECANGALPTPKVRSGSTQEAGGKQTRPAHSAHSRNGRPVNDDYDELGGLR